MIKTLRCAEFLDTILEMPYYRIYLMNTERHIRGVKIAECAGDDAAFTEAASMIGPHAGAEVWEDARLVGYLPSPRRPVGTS